MRKRGAIQIKVPPSRLDDGDIDNAYSADKIGEARPIRKPFSYRGALYVSTAGCGGGRRGQYYDAMRLVRLAEFDGDPTTYADKVHVDHGEMARNDPLGFYHGMTVSSGGETFVMAGPEVRFVPDNELAMPSKQESLF